MNEFLMKIVVVQSKYDKLLSRFHEKVQLLNVGKAFSLKNVLNFLANIHFLAE